MRLIAAFVLIAALAGCSQSDAIAGDTGNIDSLAAQNLPTSSPLGEPPANAVAAEAAQPASDGSATTIPAALHGRWGLSPRDCTSSLGDAKGLLVVNGRELRFYESRAVPSTGIQTSPDTISGTFAFTGEGQKWSRYQALQVQDGKLVRTERDPLASFTYARCD